MSLLTQLRSLGENPPPLPLPPSRVPLGKRSYYLWACVKHTTALECISHALVLLSVLDLRLCLCWRWFSEEDQAKRNVYSGWMMEGHDATDTRWSRASQFKVPQGGKDSYATFSTLYVSQHIYIQYTVCLCCLVLAGRYISLVLIVFDQVFTLVKLWLWYFGIKDRRAIKRLSTDIVIGTSNIMSKLKWFKTKTGGKVLQFHSFDYSINSRWHFQLFEQIREKQQISSLIYCQLIF